MTHFYFLLFNVRFQYSATSRHDTATSDWMVSPYMRHFNTQLRAYNFIDSLHLYMKLFWHPIGRCRHLCSISTRNSEHMILLIFYICIWNCFDTLCNISFEERLPEDGHNRWPKHVAGYAVYSTVNIHVCIRTGWSYFAQWIISAWSRII
jgi:hypothetical protein